MMTGMIILILIGLLRGVRAQRFLVLENLALRHQLAVLQRAAPRPRLADGRPVVLGLAVPSVERLEGCCLGRPTRDGDSVAADRLQARLDLEEPRARARPSGRRPGDPSAHPTDVQGPPPVGRAADSRGASEARRRDLAGVRLQVRGPPSEAALADLADFSRQSPGKPRLRGLLRRAHRGVQGLGRLRGLGARAAARRPHQCHRRPHRPMDGPATRGGVPLADCPAIPPARPRCGVRGRVLEARAVHGDPRSQDGGSVTLAESVRRTSYRHPPPRVSRPRRGAERNPSASPAERVPHYYHEARTHLSLDKDAPEPRPVEHLDDGRIVETPMVGGLYHRYTRQAA